MIEIADLHKIIEELQGLNNGHLEDRNRMELELEKEKRRVAQLTLEINERTNSAPSPHGSKERKSPPTTPPTERKEIKKINRTKSESSVKVPSSPQNSPPKERSLSRQRMPLTRNKTENDLGKHKPRKLSLEEAKETPREILANLPEHSPPKEHSMPRKNSVPRNKTEGDLGIKQRKLSHEDEATKLQLQLDDVQLRLKQYSLEETNELATMPSPKSSPPKEGYLHRHYRKERKSIGEMQEEVSAQHKGHTGTHHPRKPE
jgi:hypothetical protein